MLVLRDLASITKDNGDDENGVWANRYQGRTYRGDQKFTALTFNSCFDGRTIFGPRTKMEQYPTACITENDLVMIECTVTRFKCDANCNAVYKDGWKHWRSQLELLTVTKLIEGPEATIKEQVGIEDDVLHLFIVSLYRGQMYIIFILYPLYIADYRFLYFRSIALKT
ncbi:uncharacterized protein LAESUDRAFT_43081 [Laetiporus sulphureus 93-53]|uniref:Uncharacterized protein n=1 Tax=Laetiporus sulphureus 93-53 TaxID=1314785 RepID=A0A165F8C7_9APHY|nr:uncharacterized protein LAESUDRAFT_43081 [Laetiporus sulphureus 93-53]KZT08581.1 hypothetical protein LAESUDRAFT_43081 [Laetiporus sulphureus 93-53]